MVWLYTLENKFIYHTKKPCSKESKFYDSKSNLRMTITKFGTIIIGAGYSWNGCSPKVKIGKWIFGTPDGDIDEDTGKPITYYASLVHDALTQFYKHPDMCFTRKAMDDIFYDMLVEADFEYAYLYYFAVRSYAVVTFKK
jgi:hypothetical protein